MNWDDLRIVAAVRDEGTYAGAAGRLGLDETTVGRRVQRIQRALGVRLFDTVDGQRRATSHCERVLGHVEAMAGHAAAVARVGAGEDGVAGRFRIASTAGVAEEILAPHGARLLTRHPGLALQFLTSSSNVKFSRWQADFAIRLRKPEKGDFTISKLGEFKLYLFEPVARSNAEAVVCAYPDDLGPVPETQFLKSRGWQDQARCITDDTSIIKTLIRTHQAIGILPDHFCVDLLSDRRLRATLLPRRRDVWLLVQNHLKQDAAARAIIEWLRDCFEGFRD